MHVDLAHKSPRRRSLTGAITDALARLFVRPRDHTLVCGVNGRTRLLANQLERARQSISLVDIAVDGGSLPQTVIDAVLKEASAESAKTILAATSNHDLNERLCRSALDLFGVPCAIARMSWRAGITGWVRISDSKTERITWADAVKAVLDGLLPTGSFQRVALADDQTVVSEIELISPVFAGRTAQALPLHELELVAIRREDELFDGYEFSELELEPGDHLILMGSDERIKKFRECVASV